jgi:hypothetical protein
MWLKEATDEFHRGNQDSADNNKMLKEMRKQQEQEHSGH